MNSEVIRAIMVLVVALLFAFLGLRGLHTGKAIAEAYRFDRDNSPAMFWFVTIMWLSGAATCFLYSLGTLLGVML